MYESPEVSRNRFSLQPDSLVTTRGTRLPRVPERSDRGESGWLILATAAYRRLIEGPRPADRTGAFHDPISTDNRGA